VDGQVADSHTQPNSISFLQVSDETFDVGLDTRTELNAKDYTLPFDFTGTINNLTINLKPTQFTAAEEAKIKDASVRAD
jgi:arylsulfatase